jgi:hypothetical protein
MIAVFIARRDFLRVLQIQIGDNDCRAEARMLACALLANTACRAGDEGDSVLQRHDIPS